jgi:hypothetical protein
MKNMQLQTPFDISIEKIIEDASKIKIDENASFIKSYREFVKYFSDILGELNNHHIIIGSHFTYGWMPTIIELKNDNIDGLLKILNEVKKGKRLCSEELNQLRIGINNSLVGSSKLLHFINPNNYAIWDSRVYKYLTNLEPYDYRINNYEAYQNYLELCHKLTTNTQFEQINNNIDKQTGYKVSKFRAIEIIMYETERMRSEEEIKKKKFDNINNRLIG